MLESYLQRQKTNTFNCFRARGQLNNHGAQLELGTKSWSTLSPRSLGARATLHPWKICAHCKLAIASETVLSMDG
jgi:hypothetical protein